MSTKANRSRIREQIRRARSAERLNTRWNRSTDPHTRCKIATDYLTAYLKNAPAADQNHMAAQLKDLAGQTKATRPQAHAWMVRQLKTAHSPKRRAEIAIKCLTAYARHGSDQGVL